LSEFDFKIKHLKGKENNLAHALSRILHDVYEISYGQVESNFSNNIKEVVLKDLKYEYLWKQAKLEQNYCKETKYGINNKKLLISRGRIYIPNQFSMK